MVASGDNMTWPFVDFVFLSPVWLVQAQYLLVVRLKSLGAVQLGLVSNQVGMARGRHGPLHAMSSVCLMPMTCVDQCLPFACLVDAKRS
jgi:hypothetical protein